MLAGVATLSGPRWTGVLLADVTSTGPGPAIIRLKPSQIPALAAPGGSVQYKFIDTLPPFTLNRVTADRFVTLDSVCTHAGCTVGRYTLNRRTNTELMRCPCHGSQYDIEGRVFRDVNGNSTEPAPDDLARFETSYDVASDIVSVSIPDLKLHIESISVHERLPGNVVLLKLVFPVTAFAIYEIRYQADLASPPVPVLFSKTPGGAANQSAASPQLDGDFTAYVDASGPVGFFVVGLKLSPF